MADLAVGPQVVGANQIARVDLTAVDKLVDLVRVDSSATISSSSFAGFKTIEGP
ncbi:hypothetical protein V1286_001189 [Bradyrhizobium algeriense]|uniref:Uncharacterized protein n=1 Tax=Bradyrhizobium algeriense TaxID=634784 RepID=A0ABU8B553_9BRAD